MTEVKKMDIIQIQIWKLNQIVYNLSITWSILIKL